MALSITFTCTRCSSTLPVMFGFGDLMAAGHTADEHTRHVTYHPHGWYAQKWDYATHTGKGLCRKCQYKDVTIHE